MSTWWTHGLLAALMLAVSGCGTALPLATPQGQAESAGLFSPKIPAAQVLAPADRAADFDRYLEIAQAGAKAWSAKAQLARAEATAVDAMGGKAGGATYTYIFVAGRNGLAVTLAGNTISYAEAKALAPLSADGLVSAKAAMQAAMQLGKLSHESYVLRLEAHSQGPIYVVREFKRGEAAKVIVEARTGRVIG